VWHDLVAQCDAMSQARHADLVLLSLHGAQPLPPNLAHWLKQWATLREDRLCALVLSLDLVHEHSKSGQALASVVRTVAAPLGIAVFCHFGLSREGEADSWPSQVLGGVQTAAIFAPGPKAPSAPNLSRSTGLRATACFD